MYLQLANPNETASRNPCLLHVRKLTARNKLPIREQSHQFPHNIKDNSPHSLLCIGVVHVIMAINSTCPSMIHCKFPHLSRHAIAQYLQIFVQTVQLLNHRMIILRRWNAKMTVHKKIKRKKEMQLFTSHATIL